ncbi:ribosome maturation factor RimM [Gluconobacter wancherniae]|uniref:ribosome maturation factor RimM n=1 Tax=Gluconobacter wancherniae TaxID=1307955 RepID=UPI001B8CB0CF|nr:ribosome maturation factor RimM [Gluconobacter wancherniae]MBS1088873.1 16S rRNA processing protein RimM [Gluconobacter wancherniae]
MTRFNPESDVLVATIGRPHGVRGLVRLHAATDDPVSVEEFGTLHDEQGEEWVVRWVSPGVAALTDRNGQTVSDRTAVERVVNRRLYVAREQLPATEEDEFYHTDLIGMVAVSEAGDELGTVVTVHDYGAGVSIEIDRGLIIPFTMACVPHVDLAGRQVVVIPPPMVEVEGDLDGDVQVRA